MIIVVFFILTMGGAVLNAGTINNDRISSHSNIIKGIKHAIAQHYNSQKMGDYLRSGMSHIKGRASQYRPKRHFKGYAPRHYTIITGWRS